MSDANPAPPTSSDRVVPAAVGVLPGIALGIACYFGPEYHPGACIFVGLVGAFIGAALAQPDVSTTNVLLGTAGVIVAHNVPGSLGERILDAASDDLPAGEGSARTSSKPGPTPDEDPHTDNEFDYPDGPYTPEDFINSDIIPPVVAVSIHHMPDQIDVAPDGLGFVVGYGDYLSPIRVTEDVAGLSRRFQLALALLASPGADYACPMAVGHENVSGLMEDDFVRYECRLTVTPGNVLALRSTTFTWTDAATRLALPVDPPTESIEAVRRVVVKLARENVAVDGRLLDLSEQLAVAEAGSPEAVALAAELRELSGAVNWPVLNNHQNGVRSAIQSGGNGS